MRFTNDDETGCLSSEAPSRQASRDTATVEIVYSLFTGAIVAALLFFTVASPAFIWELSGGWNSTVMGMASAFSAAGFVYRVVSVLVRLRKVTK
ncbi:hypothetical protein DDE74_24745 [Streptomyces lydicus]|uniref:Uncharacterized protein n=1 Tax=Streptomyces lydicus TaxID=47763 RepID=A0A3S9YFD9_9ACTN|nr:DUF6332 family protein [Streptomyces lydicus]AZS73732.1 hypothetical protein DDE74_24745 [Streptomyces lydicus]